MQYYLEKRDVDFDAKMAQVLCVYKQVALYRDEGLPGDLCAVISYDEKPGMQAIANTDSRFAAGARQASKAQSRSRVCETRDGIPACRA